jgi:hypothetical protein
MILKSYLSIILLSIIYLILSPCQASRVSIQMNRGEFVKNDSISGLYQNFNKNGSNHYFWECFGLKKPKRLTDNDFQNYKVNITLNNKVMIVSLLNYNLEILKSKKFKFQVKNGHYELIRKTNIKGIPPLFWVLGSRNKILKFDSNGISFNSGSISKGGCLFILLIPIICGEGIEENCFFEKIN